MRFAILISLMALTAQLLPAEDIVLIDGRYLHVKIQEANEKGIKVQLLDHGGGQIFISWPLIIESQRIEIRRRYKLEDEEAKVIVEDGNRITTRSGDVWEGRVVNENDKELTLRHQGSNMTIPKTTVKENEKTQVNVLAIYSPEEYYKKRAAESKFADDDIPGNMELAELANNLGLYEKSFEHYKKVQIADPGYQPDVLANILKRLEELAKHKQIRDALDEARKQTMYKQFAKALAQFDAIIAIKDLPATLKSEAEVLKQKTIKARWEHFRLEVRKDYEAFLRNKIRTWARDEKLKLQDAQRKLRSDLHKEVVADVAAKHGLDAKGEVEKMWDERGFHQPRTSSYGSGSFIVLGRAPDAEKYDAQMQQYLQNVLRQQQGSKNNQNASLSAAPDKLPKPPTKDEWWARSTSSDREQWMLAFWAENAKKMIVVGERKEDCSRCGATGALSFQGSQGDTLRSTCPSCQGHKYYKGVAFK